MRIANLSTKSGSMSSSDKFVTDNGTTVTKIDYNALAKAIIEQYTGSTLAGSAQSVKAALDALNSKSFGSITGDHLAVTLEYQRVGSICIVKVNSLKDLTGNTETELGTLPAGFRPYRNDVYCDIGTPASAGFSRSLRIHINTSGIVSAYLYGSDISGTINVRTSIPFIVA